MVAIVEQADVPAAAHAGQELHQRARPLRELEAVEDLVLRRRRVPADQVPDVQLRHLVVGQVVRLDPALPELGQQLLGLAPVRDLDPDEEVRDAGVGIAIVELGDRSLAEEPAELAEAARSLGNRHRENRLALLAQLGALGDEAQPVEVHVGAAGDRDVRAVLRPVPRDPRLDAGDRRARRPARGSERVSSNTSFNAAQIASVSTSTISSTYCCAQAERLLADLLHRDPVGEQAHVRELDAAPGGERARHRVRVLGLDADHLDLRPHALHVRGDPADEPAAADRAAVVDLLNSLWTDLPPKDNNIHIKLK